MNSEILVGKAGRAIAEHARKHESSCVLSIENGEVIARPANETICNVGSCLYITRFQQQHGLASRMWNVIGTELLNIYNKEKACQAHQKP